MQQLGDLLTTSFNDSRVPWMAGTEASQYGGPPEKQAYLPVYVTHVLVVLHVVVMVAGCVGDFSMLVIFFCDRHLWKPSYMLIGFLALGDFVHLSLVGSVKILFLLKGNWTAGDQTTCTLTATLTLYMVEFTILTTVVIAVNRYVRVFRNATYYGRVFSKSKMLLWQAAILVLCSFVVFATKNARYDPRLPGCFLNQNVIEEAFLPLTAVYFGCCFTVIALYTRMLKRVRNVSRKVKPTRFERQSIGSVDNIRLGQTNAATSPTPYIPVWKLSSVQTDNAADTDTSHAHARLTSDALQKTVTVLESILEVDSVTGTPADGTSTPSGKGTPCWRLDSSPPTRQNVDHTPQENAPGRVADGPPIAEPAREKPPRRNEDSKPVLETGNRADGMELKNTKIETDLKNTTADLRNSTKGDFSRTDKLGIGNVPEENEAIPEKRGSVFKSVAQRVSGMFRVTISFSRSQFPEDKDSPRNSLTIDNPSSCRTSEDDYSLFDEEESKDEPGKGKKSSSSGNGSPKHSRPGMDMPNIPASRRRKKSSSSSTIAWLASGSGAPLVNPRSMSTGNSLRVNSSESNGRQRKLGCPLFVPPVLDLPENVQPIELSRAPSIILYSPEASLGSKEIEQEHKPEPAAESTNTASDSDDKRLGVEKVQKPMGVVKSFSLLRFSNDRPAIPLTKEQRQVMSEQHRRRRHTRERKGDQFDHMKYGLVCCVLSIVCCMPFFVFFLSNEPFNVTISKLGAFSHLLVLLASALNCVGYGVMNSSFHQSARTWCDKSRRTRHGMSKLSTKHPRKKDFKKP